MEGRKELLQVACCCYGLNRTEKEIRGPVRSDVREERSRGKGELTITTGRPERWRMEAEEGIRAWEPSRRRAHGDATAAAADRESKEIRGRM